MLGGPLETCGTDPLTGFYRDGCCRTGPGDFGSHTICAVVSGEFLEYQRSIGNDLSSPAPEHDFPGLQPGDRWCVTTQAWLRAHEEGVAAFVVLAATHERGSISSRSTCSSSTRSTYPPIRARSTLLERLDRERRRSRR